MPTFFISTENRWSIARPKDKDGGFPFHSLVRHWINSVWGHNLIRSIRSSESKIQKLCLNILIWYINYKLGPANIYTCQSTFLFPILPKPSVNSTLLSPIKKKKKHAQHSKKQKKTTSSKDYQENKLSKNCGRTEIIRLAIRKPDITTIPSVPYSFGSQFMHLKSASIRAPGWLSWLSIGL